MKYYRKLGLFFFFTVLLLIVSCERSSKKLYIPFNTQISKICPGGITAQNWVSLSLQINETLFSLNKYGEIRPLLIDDWEVNKSRDEYKFKLKKGILFHNSKELVSNDVIYSYRKMKENKALHTSSKFIGKILNISYINKYEFSIKLKEALPDFLFFLASSSLRIYPDNMFENEPDCSKQWVGTGAFFLDLISDKSIVLKRFDRYREKHGVTELHFVSTKGSSLERKKKQLKMFHDKRIDLMHIDRGEVEDYKKNKLLKVSSHPILGSFFVGFDMNNPVFQNKNLRLAIFHSIDRAAIIKSYKVPKKLIPDSILPFGVSGYVAASTPSFNIKLAKRYLSKIEKNNLPLAKDFKIIVPKNFHPMGVHAIKIINKGLRELKLPKITYTELNEDYGKGNIGNYYSYLQKNNFNLYIRGMIFDIPSSFFMLHGVYSEKSSLNFGRIKNAKIQNIFKDITLKGKKWDRSVTREMINITSQERYIIPLGNLFNNVIMRRDKNLHYQAISPLYIRYKDFLEK